MNRRTSVIAALAAVLFAAPAVAQKSADTVRMPLIEPIQGADDYTNPNPEMEFVSAAVFDGLVDFDEDTNSYQPLLASAWKRIDERAVEFDLRTDVVWHDGEKFDADDVVYTMGWLIDPQTKLRNKANFEWVAKVEKLGTHKVRISTNAPIPADLAHLSRSFFMVPEHVHAKLPQNEKLPFSMSPVGTGMFKVKSVDSNKGVFLAKSPAYAHGGRAKPAGNVGNLHLLFIPDQQVRVAQFMVGNLEMIARQITHDELDFLTGQPGVKGAIVQGPSIAYMAIDAQGRSGLKALTDVRVRRALMMAVDRNELTQLATGKHSIDRVPEAMCWKDQVGCDYSVALPAYDPAGAKRLLAEAGFPDGIDIELSTFNTSVSDAAVAVANQWARAGIRASVKRLTIGAYRLALRDHKVQVAVIGYPVGNIPDVERLLTYFVLSSQDDLAGDAELKTIAARMTTMFDAAERKKLGRQIFDAFTERGYYMPVGPRPVQIVYRDSLDVKMSRYVTVGFNPGKMNWK